MNQGQLQENRSTVQVGFAGCFYAAKEMFGQPVKTLMNAVEGDSHLSNARVVKFTSIIDPPQDVVAYLSHRPSASVPVINVVTSCFERNGGAPTLDDGRVLMWIDGLWPRLERDIFNKFLGLVVESPETAEFRDITKGEREKYHIPANRIFDVPKARFRRIGVLSLERFSIFEGHGSPGIEVVCRVRAANVPHGKRKGVTYALSEVEVTEPGYRGRGHAFAYRLVAYGLFGIKYKSLHPAHRKRFGCASEFIHPATPLPLIEAAPVKTVV